MSKKFKLEICRIENKRLLRYLLVNKVLLLTNNIKNIIISR